MAGTGDPAARWQSRFDRTFRYGAFWNPRYDGHPMPIAWVLVSSMKDDMPVLVIYPGGVDRMPWENMVLSSMTEQQHVPLVMELVFENRDHPSTWTAVGRLDKMRQRLAPWREYYQSMARGEGGKVPA